jgi:hypothetical protein
VLQLLVGEAAALKECGGGPPQLSGVAGWMAREEARELEALRGATERTERMEATAGSWTWWRRRCRLQCGSGGSGGGGSGGCCGSWLGGGAENVPMR